MSRRTSRRALPVVSGILLLLTAGNACDGAAPSPGDPHVYNLSDSYVALERQAAPALTAMSARWRGDSSAAALVRPVLDSTGPAAALLIRDGRVSLEVDSLEPAVAEVHALAARLGGYVGGTDTRMGRGQVRSAAVALKVPSDRFDEALSAVRPIGEVESVTISTQDVTEEYVDVGARMENARRLERRLAQILANRTGALKDVLEVERALARVREEIERYEGRLRYLRQHAAMSSLMVHLHEPAPFMGHAGESVLGAAFDQAWANFVSLAVLFVHALGFVIPLGVLAAIGWLGVRRFGHHLA
jgi:hypothetical protein